MTDPPDKSTDRRSSRLSLALQLHVLRPAAVLFLCLFVGNLIFHWTDAHKFRGPYTWHPIANAYPGEQQLIDVTGFQCAVLYQAMGTWTTQGPGFTASSTNRDAVLPEIYKHCR